MTPKELIAVPTEGDRGIRDRASGIFAKAPFFTFIEVIDKQRGEIIVQENDASKLAQGTGPLVMKNLKDSGVDVVLAGEVGLEGHRGALAADEVDAVAPGRGGAGLPARVDQLHRLDRGSRGRDQVASDEIEGLRGRRQAQGLLAGQGREPWIALVLAQADHETRGRRAPHSLAIWTAALPMPLPAA